MAEEETKSDTPKGLSQVDSSELNRPDPVKGILATRFSELRLKYAGNPLAQLQIDRYDPESEEHKLVVQHRNAAKIAKLTGDWSQEQLLFKQLEQYELQKYGIDTSRKSKS